MGDLIDAFGGKLPGELILSDDWNGLVAALEQMGAALGTRIDELTDRLVATTAELDGRITVLEEGQAELRTVTGHLRDHHVLVTMETARTHYATGELAELTARVTDIAGAPLDLSDVAGRPWVAFVTAWGRLRPAPGTTALEGAEGRSVAVRVDGDGSARVRLQAELAEGLTAEDEDEVAGALTTGVGATAVSLAETFLSAATPVEAANRGAFALVTQQYEQESAPAIRRYTDQYYTKNTALISRTIRPIVTTRWRDHRATVMAFVQPDADPATPDASLGSSSLHVRFRDWIGPWIVLDYLDRVKTGELVASARDRLVPRVGSTFSGTVLGLQEEVEDFVRADGLLGRIRDYQVLSGALDTLSVDGAPAFLSQATRTLQQAVNLQQVVEPAQVAAQTGVRKVGVEALAGTAVRSVGEVSALKGALDAVQADVGSLDSRMATVQQDVTGLDGKVEVAVSQTLGALDAKVETVRGQVSTIQAIYPEPVREKLLDFHTKLLDVDDLKRRVGRLET